jgi:hypothetical protein
MDDQTALAAAWPPRDQPAHAPPTRRRGRGLAATPPDRQGLVQAWLAVNPRVRVLHGARYRPHDNPVERIWASLKAFPANRPTATMAGRIRQVHAFFRQRAPAQTLATAAASSSPWLPEGDSRNLRQAA